MYKKYYISDITDEMIKKMRMEAVVKYSKKYGIEAELVLAMIRKESENNPFAMRLEPHLKKASWYNNTLRGLGLLKDFHYCSFGYLQIMYGTAKHIGYLGAPFGLLNPDKAIKYGLKYLKWCIRRYKGKVWDGVSAYNQGNNRFYDVNKNGIKDAKEKYYNQPYVSLVKKYYQINGGRNYL
jgi:soluble lytic murein transglycosylase-like protein